MSEFSSVHVCVGDLIIDGVAARWFKYESEDFLQGHQLLGGLKKF